MATFKQNLRSIKLQRQALEKAQDNLYSARLSIQRKTNPQSLASVKKSLTSVQEKVDIAQNRLANAIAILNNNSSYTRVANELDANIPVLFFPVRMETRLVDVKNKPQLWVRIYPDDIHINSFEPLLTDKETEFGKTYWLELLRANRERKDDKEQKKDLWNNLTQRSGVQRALWIVKSTQPKNWQTDLNVADDKLEFPQTDITKTHDWTRAPKTQILPDRFVLQIHNSSLKPNDPALAPVVGKPVADTVFTGPDPFLAEEAFKKSAKGIELDNSFAWTSDFNKAVNQGLGFKVPLKAKHLNKGKIERITVMGIMASADPLESQTLLESHIESLRYSNKGFSFLKQGMATNNTAKSGSSYNNNSDDLEKGFYDGSDPVKISSKKQSDGFLLASSLGINPDIFNSSRHAEKTEVKEARAMCTALYPATIGHFVSVLSDPAIGKSSQDKLQDFFSKYVNATGPLSSIRVGDQPYGLLVTSDFRRWKETDKFSSQMTFILKVLQSRWNGMMRSKVPHVNKRGDASRLLLEILGLNAGSVSFKQRLAHLHDFSLTLSNVRNISSQLANKQNKIMQLFKSGGYTKKRLPFISNLSFYNHSENIRPRYLVDRKKPDNKRFLDRSGIKKQNFIQWLGSANKISDIDKQIKSGSRPPRSVLYFLLRHSLLLELQKAAARIYKDKGYAYNINALDKTLINFDKKTQDITSWEILNGAPNKVDPRKIKIKIPMGDHLLNLDKKSPVANRLIQYKTALKTLAPLSTGRLHQCLTDHLDLCSYRLDAWQTGLFYRRLEKLRKDNAKGIYLGAYGWVENLSVKNKEKITIPAAFKAGRTTKAYHNPDNAGFVHTPSLNHATAAGMLLAGYTANASKSSADNFAVNLSSQRVRKALFIYEGIQNGQTVEALLGYQFERALHEATLDSPATNLNQYIFRLREKYPIEHISVAQKGTQAQEVVPVFNVVNGLKIINIKNTDLNKLEIPTAHHQTILDEADNLADTLDAIGDLLTSESAYQMVQGKMQATAAVLNSLQDAELPPDLEVNKTPRSTHLQVKNKVCIQFSSMEGMPLNTGWSDTGTPRSMLEPGINAWLGSQIGNPASIRCRVSIIDESGAESAAQVIKLSDLQLQPIDLVYAAGIDVQGGARELELIVYQHSIRTRPLSDGEQFKIHFADESLADNSRSFSQLLPLLRLLRMLITTGYAASAADFSSQSRKVNETDDDLHAWQTTELKTRALKALNQLRVLLNTINSKAPNSITPKDRNNPENFNVLFENYISSGNNADIFSGIQLNASAINSLVDFISAVRLFGIKTDIPDNIDINKADTLLALLSSAVFSWMECNTKLHKAEADNIAEAATPKPGIKLKHLRDAIKAIAGDDFIILPKFKFRNASDVEKTVKESGKFLMKYISDKTSTQPDLALETWMTSTSAVRPNMARLEQIRMIAEFTNAAEMTFIPAQLPYKTSDNWLSVEFPESDAEGNPFEVLSDTVSLCIHGLKETDVNKNQAVLIIDEWTESVPNAKEITGISYNYNQPDSSAPNALLLAVEPGREKKWSWKALENILDDTLNRAKTRAVEPAHLLADPALDTLVPMTVASFDLHNSGLSLDYLMTNTELVRNMQQKNFELYANLDI